MMCASQIGVLWHHTTLPPARCLPRAATRTSEQTAIDDILRVACGVKNLCSVPILGIPNLGRRRGCLMYGDMIQTRVAALFWLCLRFRI